MLKTSEALATALRIRKGPCAGWETMSKMLQIQTDLSPQGIGLTEFLRTKISSLNAVRQCLVSSSGFRPDALRGIGQRSFSSKFFVPYVNFGVRRQEGSH
jgi:hypothetical protein